MIFNFNLIGDKLNNHIENGKNEFDNGNYEKALDHFKLVNSNNEHYEYAQLFVANCLMELKRYDDSLDIVDKLISLNPYNKLAWFNRALCQIFLKDEEKALATIGEIIRLIDLRSKYDLVFVAKLYKLLNIYDEALKFCDLALEIDENFKDALYEKSLVAMRLDDDELINDVWDRLLELSDGGPLGFMSVFILKLFSKNYSACIDLINGLDGDKFDDEHIMMLKAMVYQQICEDLCVNLLVVNSEDFPLDDALDAMIDFVENKTDNGKINGVQYYII